MIELRWGWHNRSNQTNTTGCVNVGRGLLQKLQFREKQHSPYVGEEYIYTEWQDVPHIGEVAE